MKAIESFTVAVKLPPELGFLSHLAANLRWCWDTPTQELFASIDPAAWAARHDPVRLLVECDPGRLEHLGRDRDFVGRAEAAMASLQGYLESRAWFQDHGDPALGRVAYFSPEFGITEALAQYSGGLGVLAGDHLKASSDLGLPLIGVGLLYRYGYFHQGLDPRGWQTESYPPQDPHALALSQVVMDPIDIKIGPVSLGAQLWRADVGRVRLYLLDSDIPANPANLRSVTDRLYGGDIEHRLVQEILLGMGGVRALQAAGETATVFHSNEGHAGFLGLERIRDLVQRHSMSFEEALEATRAGTVFTTHTPVPAGIDRFPVELMEKYFSGWAGECGISMAQFMELGHFPDEDYSAPFNMAVMGLRLAGSANGVSRLHGSVSREMFAPLWGGLDADEVPIGSVTNGVHAPSWVSSEMAGVLDDVIGQSWADSSPGGWDGVGDMDEQVLWQVRQTGRAHLVDFVRARLGADGDEILDPDTLTIGFARRFATYKRATLLLSDPDRLRRLITEPERRVQFVFAGKAHPADDEGKEMIRRISDFAIEAGVSSQFVFIPDYDIAVARALYQGCDVWLNTPRRPMEACGTSGEKAALNGSLNLSVLDGWWAEYFDGTNGWAVPTAGYSADLEGRDATEAETLFRILENQVVPAFYDTTAPGQGPPAWLKLVKASLVSLGPKVSAARMVKDYTAGLYRPAARRAEDLAADDFRRARDLAAWKSGIIPTWANVEVVRVSAARAPLDPQGPLHLTAWVDLAGLVPEEVRVEAVHGPVDADGEIANPTVVVMELAPDPVECSKGTAFGVEIEPSQAGPYGYTVRARPSNPDLGCPAEAGLAPRFLAGT